MKKFEVTIPLIAYIYVKVEAEDEEEALEKVESMVDKGEVETYGFDTEPICNWDSVRVGE